MVFLTSSPIVLNTVIMAGFGDIYYLYHVYEESRMNNN